MAIDDETLLAQLDLSDIDYSDLEAKYAMPEDLSPTPDFNKHILIDGLPIIDPSKREKLVTHLIKY